MLFTMKFVNLAILFELVKMINCEDQLGQMKTFPFSRRLASPRMPRKERTENLRFCWMFYRIAFTLHKSLDLSQAKKYLLTIFLCVNNIIFTVFIRYMSLIIQIMCGCFLRSNSSEAAAQTSLCSV
ncbi:hypothetical protein FACHB389_31275 [Nostoc calcicola FACHB-389]|nr:hypothetical protein FACHB389_31275 [Nostoc calcicola FACHB-389]